jgi:two-component system cell cycle sensor histidine kinase/response regulator CckA
MVDLTPQKRAEEALRKTAEQLRQAQKMEAVGRLAGGVAHDFNNILTVILSYTAMISADLAPTDPMRADIEEIGEAGRRAADLTRQLLTFSRQEIVDTKVLDLNAVVTNLQKLLRRVIGEDVALVFTPAAHLGMVRADPSHLEQVIMNLSVNARDAMPQGGRLTIETADVELDAAYGDRHHGVAPGRYVMLAVSDTGCGMSADVQQRIFEPFFTTKEKGKGTGLGLSTVFGIVQQSGGSIWVYSEVANGTVFKVYFPRVDATPDAALPAFAPKTARGSETILLVEDDDRVRAVALEILRKQGYRVIEARNAGEALLSCERHAEEIHILLTDVVMPQMSGPELAKRVTSGHPNIKILCMSGYTDDAVVRHGALEAGIAFLQKPFTPKSLAEKVRAVLDHA